MSKLLKILGRSVSISAEWILITFIVFVFAIRMPNVQTFLGEKATNFLSAEMNAEISIGAIEIVFFDRVYLKEVSVIDPMDKPILFVNELNIEIDQQSLFNSDLVFSSITLNQGAMHISRDQSDGVYNFQFIIDYFGSSEKENAAESKLFINELLFSDLLFTYDDFRVQPLEKGVDFNHLELSNLGVEIEDFELSGSSISAQIDNLFFDERSGLGLRLMRCSAEVSNQNIHLAALELVTEKSNFSCSKFDFNFNDWSSFGHFSSEVNMNVKLNPSRISLEELALFVPRLRGMDAVFDVEAIVKNTVATLQLSNTKIGFGKSTFIEGDFELPDLSSRTETTYNQLIRNAYVDFSELDALKLPDGSASLNLDFFMPHRFASFSDLDIAGGLDKLNVSFGSLQTGFGTISMPDSYVLNLNEEGYTFRSPVASVRPIVVNDFDLGSYIQEELFGDFSGVIFPTFAMNTKGDFTMAMNNSKLSKFDLNGYPISQVYLDSIFLKNDKLDFKMRIEDANVNLNAHASIGLKSHNYNGAIHISGINLDALNLTNDSSYIVSDLNFDLAGQKDLEWGGVVHADRLQYSRGVDTLVTDAISLNIDAEKGHYDYQLQSEFFDAGIDGTFSWGPLFENFYSDLAVIFPSLKVGTKKKGREDELRDNHLVEFFIKSKSVDSLLNFFTSGVHLDSASLISGRYNAYSHDLDLDVEISSLLFGDVRIDGLFGEQQLHNDSIFADYLVDFISYKDSLRFNLIEFYTFGTQGVLESQLSWDPVSDRYSKIDWETSIHDKDHVEILLKPSFFSLESFRWEIVNESDISITSEDIHIEQFELSREEQNIKINGCLSENDFDQLYVYTRNVDVSEISSILGLERSLEGLLSGWSVFSNPYNNFHYIGDLNLKEFHVAKESIGDVWLRTGWNNELNALGLRGELKVDNLKTFDIKGSYFITRQDLDLELKFDNTDVAFLNALVDPEVITNISGDLDGLLRATGRWYEPVLEGTLALDDVHAKVALLGVDYYLDGVIDVQQELFALNNIPLKDKEGNTGSVIGSVFHDNFQNWSYDIQLNFEDDITKRQKEFPFGFEPLKQFLILDTEYKDGDSYFGKAYGRGSANIFGYGENMTITVNVLTQENTILNFPMYGSSDIEEDFEFVNFRSNLELDGAVEKKFDFTGLDLDLNFNFDPSSRLNIIFDPSSGDQIQAYGSGNINMKLNPFYEIDLNGTYTISEGSTYNFAMGLIKQNFAIEKGSTISWTGDPYNADIDLVTSFSIPKVSLKDLAPELVLSDQESRQMKNQKVDCYLNLEETLLAPQISFDIKAVNAPETGKALLNEVVSEESELSKQFFSLLLLRSFQPLNSSIEAHASAAKDLAESQVNALLGDVSEEYDLNFSSVVDEDLIGLDLIEFGISRRFFNDRLIVSGNFGFEEDSTSNSSESSYIPVGDLFVEYLINESGTFRATAFREADPYNVGTDESGQKPYTQGAGLSYQEDFTNINDFKLIQYFFDIFRPKTRRRYLGKNINKLTAIDS